MKTYTITITDEKTGEICRIQTVRTAQDIYHFLEETENDAQLLEEMTNERNE